MGFLKAVSAGEGRKRKLHQGCPLDPSGATPVLCCGWMQPIALAALLSPLLPAMHWLEFILEPFALFSDTGNNEYLTSQGPRAALHA